MNRGDLTRRKIKQKVEINKEQQNDIEQKEAVEDEDIVIEQNKPAKSYKDKVELKKTISKEAKKRWATKNKAVLVKAVQINRIKNFLIRTNNATPKDALQKAKELHNQGYTNVSLVKNYLLQQKQPQQPQQNQQNQQQATTSS